MVLVNIWGGVWGQGWLGSGTWEMGWGKVGIYIGKFPVFHHLIEFNNLIWVFKYGGASGWLWCLEFTFWVFLLDWFIGDSIQWSDFGVLGLDEFFICFWIFEGIWFWFGVLGYLNIYYRLNILWIDESILMSVRFEI